MMASASQYSNAPDALPRGASQPKGDATAHYALTDPVNPKPKRKRTVRARQDVVASVIGALEPGGTYLITYDAARTSLDRILSLRRTLARFANRFDPPINFYVIDYNALCLDLGATNAATEPSLLDESAKTPSMLKRVERYYPPAQ